MKCQYCGKKIKSDIDQCPSCGAPVPEEIKIYRRSNIQLTSKDKKIQKKGIFKSFLYYLLFLAIGLFVVPLIIYLIVYQ